MSKYVVVRLPETGDGSPQVYGTPNGSAYASFEAAKDGRGRLVERGLSMWQLVVVEIEGVPNL